MGSSASSSRQSKLQQSTHIDRVGCRPRASEVANRSAPFVGTTTCRKSTACAGSRHVRQTSAALRRSAETEVGQSGWPNDGKGSMRWAKMSSRSSGAQH